jgi:hypothetical protein
MRLLHSFYLAFMGPFYGFDIAFIWLLPTFYMALNWLLSGFDRAFIWL